MDSIVHVRLIVPGQFIFLPGTSDTVQFQSTVVRSKSLVKFFRSETYFRSIRDLPAKHRQIKLHVSTARSFSILRVLLDCKGSVAAVILIRGIVPGIGIFRRCREHARYKFHCIECKHMPGTCFVFSCTDKFQIVFSIMQVNSTEINLFTGSLRCIGVHDRAVIFYVISCYFICPLIRSHIQRGNNRIKAVCRNCHDIIRPVAFLSKLAGNGRIQVIGVSCHRTGNARCIVICIVIQTPRPP